MTADFWEGRRPTLMFPRAIVYTTADRPRFIVPNKYPSGLIGVGVRLWGRKLLSVQWARP